MLRNLHYSEDLLPYPLDTGYGFSVYYTYDATDTECGREIFSYPNRIEGPVPERCSLASSDLRIEPQGDWSLDFMGMMKKPYSEWTEEQKDKQRARAMAWRKANPERHRASLMAWKAAHTKEVREYNRVWQRINIEKHRASNRVWVASNPDKNKESKRKWNLAHPDKDHRGEWRKSHRMECRLSSRSWNLAHRDECRTYERRWRKKNPHKRLAFDHARRARIAGNGGRFTANEWVEIKEQFSYTRPDCGRREPEIKLVADHMIPLVMGGSSNINNIQPLCGKCNSGKHTKALSFNPYNN